jgi:exonuclease III
MYISLTILFTYFVTYITQTSNPTVENSLCTNFSIMTYNVHGLPMFMTLDNTYERMENITKLLKPNKTNNNNFDIINFQEDWTHPGNEILTTNLITNKHDSYSWSQWLDEYTHDYSLFGSGLLQLSKEVPIEAHHQIFTKRHGYDDIWANKGFQVARFPHIDIYNTHLDAGKKEGDQQARQENLQQIAEFATNYSRNRAILIGGDTNLFDNAIDNASYHAFIQELNLTEATGETHIDKFFFRPSHDLIIQSSTVIIDDFDNLSDHKMVHATFEFCIPFGKR